MTPSSEVLILRRIRALARALPGAGKGDVHAIHQARVATRRLREALPLVVDGVKGRKLERSVRALTRRLGPVRELDVVRHTLDELQASTDVPRRALECLRVVVNEERRRLNADVKRRIADFDLDQIRRKAAAGARRHDAALAGSRPRESGPRRRADPRRVASADRRVARRSASLRVAIEQAAGIYLPDRLHAVRIAVKKLRYAMEVARDLRQSRAQVRIRTLKRVQELLGRMHDLEVMIARTRAVQGSPRAADLRLSADLDRLVRHLENECRMLHGQYIASRPALLAVCESAGRSSKRKDAA